MDFRSDLACVCDSTGSLDLGRRADNRMNAKWFSWIVSDALPRLPRKPGEWRTRMSQNDGKSAQSCHSYRAAERRLHTPCLSEASLDTLKWLLSVVPGIVQDGKIR